MARNEYPPEVQAQVLAALLEGQSISKVAEVYKVPEGTIKSWKARLSAVPSVVATEKRAIIGELLLDYLEENLRTLKEQNVIFRDPKWLKDQGASALAVLHGVITDKTIRLLEAMGRQDGTEPE